MGILFNGERKVDFSPRENNVTQTTKSLLDDRP